MCKHNWTDYHQGINHMKKRTTKISLAIATAMLGSTISMQAQAAGFALIEFSASGMGNAFAGAAATAEDASTVQFNPAGMSLLDGDQLSGVFHVILPSSEFVNNGSQSAFGDPLTGAEDDGGRNAFVPNFYWVKQLGNDAAFGISVTTPFGLATQYDDNWIGRYHAVESDVRTININPSISSRVNDKLSLGAGINVQYVDVILSSAVDFGALCVAQLDSASCGALGALPQQADGFAKLTGDTISVGWNIGMMYEFTQQTRMGLAYRSQLKHKVNGDADFTVPSAVSFITDAGAFADTGLQATITLPDSLSASVLHQMNDDLTLLADVTWTGWAKFEELRIIYDNPLQPDSVTTENWDNALRFSIGANYKMSDTLKLRGGLAVDNTPVPSAERRTPRIPGDNRTWVSLGVQYQLDKNMTVDVGYSHLFVNDTTINNTFESSVPTLNATLTGSYQASVDILSAQLSWKY